MKKIVSIFSKWIFASKRTWFLWAVFVIALIIRIGIIIVASHPDHPEMYEHGAIAHNLYTGHGFAMHWPYESLDSQRVALMKLPPQYESAYQPPLNPYLIYGAYLIFGENRAAIIFLMLFYAVISSFMPLVVFKTGMLIGNEASARISSLISVLFLPAAFAVITFSGSALHQLLGLVILFLAITATQKPSLRSFFTLGICCGAMTLLRSEFLIVGFLLIITLLFFASKKSHLKRIVSWGGISFIACAAVIAPWTFRNYALFHKFVPIVDRPWHEIWRGNNMYATASSFDGAGIPIWVHASRFPKIIAAMDSIPYDQYFSIRVDSIFRNEALTYMQQHPSRDIELVVKKIFALMTIAYFPGMTENPLYILCILFVSFTSIAGMIAVVQKARLMHDYSITMLYAVFFGYYCIIVMATFILPRYQIYIFSVLLPLTGLGTEKIATIRIFRRNKAILEL